MFCPTFRSLQAPSAESVLPGTQPKYFFIPSPDSDGLRGGGGGGAQPRAIDDYDYDKEEVPREDSIFAVGDGGSSFLIDPPGRRRDEPTAQDSQRKPVSVQVVRIDDTLKEVPGLVRDFKRIGVVAATDSSTEDYPDTVVPLVELSKISSPSTSTTPARSRPTTTRPR